MTPKPQETKLKINEWDYFKLNGFCTEKKKSTNEKTMEWEKTFANAPSDKFIVKLYKEFLELNIRKINNKMTICIIKATI